MVGFFPLNNATAPVESPADVDSFFSSASATVTTVLPNVVLSTPAPSTPSYLFNSSIPAPTGKIMSTGLGTSTYIPALNTRHRNATLIPTVTPSPSLVTFIVTSDGQVVTSVSTVTPPMITLGQPAGWNLSNGNAALCVTASATTLWAFVSLAVILFTTDISLL